MVRRMQQPSAPGFDRPGRQIRRVRGFLQEPERSPAARRPGARCQGEHHLDRIGAARSGPMRSRNWSASTASWCPADSARRGVEGMLHAIRYAREYKVPYFGICLGMQTMVIEFARNVCGLHASQLHRIRSGHARPRDLQAARAEGRRRAGRHHAPGRVSLSAGREQLRAPGLRQRAKSASGTAIATNSTANTRPC